MVFSQGNPTPSESHCISHLREPQPPESSESSAKISQSKKKNRAQLCKSNNITEGGKKGILGICFLFFVLPPKNEHKASVVVLLI